MEAPFLLSTRVHWGKDWGIPGVNWLTQRQCGKNFLRGREDVAKLAILFGADFSINMIKPILTIAGGLFVALMIITPATRAQSSDPSNPRKAAATTNEVAKAEKKRVAGPFHGRLAAVDKTARTITVGKRTFQITTQTRIRKSNRAATLEEGIVGEPVSGYVKPIDDGKWIASSVNFGPKTDQKKAAK